MIDFILHVQRLEEKRKCMNNLFLVVQSDHLHIKLTIKIFSLIVFLTFQLSLLHLMPVVAVLLFSIPYLHIGK